MTVRQLRSSFMYHKDQSWCRQKTDEPYDAQWSRYLRSGDLCVSARNHGSLRLRRLVSTYFRSPESRRVLCISKVFYRIF